MSVDNIISSLKAYSTSPQSEPGQFKRPPVDQWHPPFCGDIDLQIKSDGQWFYLGTPFKRPAMVKLFASVLKKEGDNYYLVTPVEKIGIQVDDAPFLITQWQWQDEQEKNMIVSTNLGESFVLDNKREITIAKDGSLYINVWANLSAKVHRNVYYQWLEIAHIEENTSQTEVYFFSGEKKFVIGKVTN